MRRAELGVRYAIYHFLIVQYFAIVGYLYY